MSDVVKGYVIRSPHADNLKQDIAAWHTFAGTAAGAWRMFVRNGDPLKRQRWVEQGYKPVPAMMMILPSEEKQ